MSDRLRRVLLAALLLLVVPTVAPAAAVAAPDPEGRIHFVKRTDGSFDRFMNAPSTEFKAWMNQKFWRSEVFTPYFDWRTSWYDKGWVYKDSYAMYDDTLQGRPDWVFKDASGRRLYIPWGCGGGSCPQYAGDFTNPAFRAWWIAGAKAEVARGYKGIWVDDVNLDLRVGDGSGRDVRPIDQRTGREITDTAWRDAMATFMEELRAALPPSVEILHNSIWYAGGAQRDRGPEVRRQIAAADYINLERGVNDDGLTGGNGEWSLQAVLGFVDRVHAAGTGVIYDAFDGSAQGREYNLATYLLTSEGDDGVGLMSMTPENWWPLYDADLGRACGPRTSEGGILRRSFAGGVVLVNEPGAPRRTVQLPTALVDASGGSVTSVDIPAKGGAVLRGVMPCGATPALEVSSTVPVASPSPPVATPAGQPAASTSPPVPPSPSLPVAAPPVPSAQPVALPARAELPTLPVEVRAPRPRVVLTKLVNRSRKGSRPRDATVHGHVSGARTGTVRVTIRRTASAKKRTVSTRVTALRGGRFQVRTGPLLHGRYVVTASFLKVAGRAEMRVTGRAATLARIKS